ncbi:uncharacterized protein BJ212DRAFT_1344362 [Suillus subaureus]|uniref:Uncharacterized protein n=1 Tax=Suillus subaureus TaxID=48587 RepID=A0A9P7JF61_9AGAM|nr:uncharacterized protein BJ212DRAFT_1344362 [Suillus subaureus]KAG1819151.1 hypothetical protein BJ212DRAFT_1344362 [Suillus subaureus]
MFVLYLIVQYMPLPSILLSAPTSRARSSFLLCKYSHRCQIGTSPITVIFLEDIVTMSIQDTTLPYGRQHGKGLQTLRLFRAHVR